jgi:4-hydroxy-tetrahydrodipicolinate reductase
MNKLALSGYGKMGKEVEVLALNYGFEVVATIENKAEWESKRSKIIQADVIIDFSMPEVVIDNIYQAFDLNIPIVVGTTGWHANIDTIKVACQNFNGSIIYGSNFSIGVNLFFEINKKLALLMNDHNNYDVDIEEIHHKHKLDSPSGTAITLANQIIENISTKEAWVNTQTTQKNLLPILSIRKDEVPGTHIISYKSDVDQLTITHQAFNRRGFASGALWAANWIIGKKGIYNFSDILFNKD